MKQPLSNVQGTVLSSKTFQRNQQEANPLGKKTHLFLHCLALRPPSLLCGSLICIFSEIVQFIGRKAECAKACYVSKLACYETCLQSMHSSFFFYYLAPLESMLITERCKSRYSTGKWDSCSV